MSRKACVGLIRTRLAHLLDSQLKLDAMSVVALGAKGGCTGFMATIPLVISFSESKDKDKDNVKEQGTKRETTKEQFITITMDDKCYKVTNVTKIDYSPVTKTNWKSSPLVIMPARTSTTDPLCGKVLAMFQSL